MGTCATLAGERFKGEDGLPGWAPNKGFLSETYQSFHRRNTSLIMLAMVAGKGRTVATILKLIEHLLETSSFGLTAYRMEGTALINVLRFLAATAEDRR
jgi:hypothetical protein